MFTNRFVRDCPCLASAACVIPVTGTVIQSCLPFHTSFIVAELGGLHLEANYLAVAIPQLAGSILCNSQQDLLVLLQPDQAGITIALLHAKLATIKASGVCLSFHWLPSHIGIAGNEETAAVAKAAYHSDTSVVNPVALSGYSQQRL